jgi:hypothetical protein
MPVAIGIQSIGESPLKGIHFRQTPSINHSEIGPGQDFPW